MNCNLCNSDDFILIQKGNIDISIHLERFSQYKYYGDLFKCKNCNLIAQKLEHEESEIIKKLMDECYLDEEIGKLNIAEKHVQFGRLIEIMEKYVSLEEKFILDAGANTGVFLDLLKKYSTSLAGIEPSREATGYAKDNYNIDIQNSVIAEADLEDEKFDVVAMWDVIEHLYDPFGDLSFLHRKTKKGGVIFISTHNIGDFWVKVMRANYPFYMYQHFYHFSKDTLAKILEKVGFEVIGVDSFCKSWTVRYLKELACKQSKYFGLLLDKVIPSAALDRSYLTLPIPHFFVITARKS